MRRVIITSSLIFSFIITGTLLAILYARGYRIVPRNGRTQIEGTGLLVVTSKPDGARVLVNNHLTTATNSTINLEEGEYEVKIEKDGYFGWNKKITIKKEVVSKADAVLFPLAPKLESITIAGANNPTLDSTGTLVAYATSPLSTPNKNGLYILDMKSQSILPFGGLLTQVANNSVVDFTASTLSFSPDGSELIASISGALGTSSYLLNPKTFNDNPQDVTATLPIVLRDWERQNAVRQKKVLDSLPKKIRALATTYFTDMILSPNEDKILYLTTSSTILPLIIEPPILGVNSTPETRKIEEGSIYVYDIKEDRNYLLFAKDDLANQSIVKYFVWYPSSNHVIYIKDKKIHVTEFDGQNDIVLYGGPFYDNIVYPWPDGSGLVLLNNFNTPDAPFNLYKVVIK